MSAIVVRQDATVQTLFLGALQAYYAGRKGRHGSAGHPGHGGHNCRRHRHDWRCRLQRDRHQLRHISGCHL